jgi:hypothetical protein
VDPVPGDGLGRVGACRRPRRAAERREVEVVGAATAAATRGQRHAAESVQGGGGDGAGDGAVDVGVAEGPAGVGEPELPEHHPQREVVPLGDLVEPRDTAGGRVVVARAAREQGELLGLAADRQHPRDHHRPRSGSDHGLHGSTDKELAAVLEDTERSGLRSLRSGQNGWRR